MLTSRADVVMRAQIIAKDLTDLERIAVGATLIGTVQDPGRFAEVSKAARQVDEHSTALARALLQEDLPKSDGDVVTGKATTHKKRCPSDRPKPIWAWGAGRAVLGRAARQEMAQPKRPFPETLWGDLLAGLCMALICCGLLFCSLIFDV